MNYVLKVVGPTGLAYRGFQWPLEVGVEVEAPDWSPEEACGRGLHGWLNGQGDLSAADYWDDAKWLVLSVDSYVPLDGKIKFQTCEILFVGDRVEACKYLYSKVQPEDVAQSIGYVSNGTIANSGQLGTSTSGNCGTSTSGYGGTSTSGNRGTSSSGYCGTSSSGYRGTSTSGDGGEIRIRYWDSNAQLYRTKVGYVGEDGIKANTPYKLNEQHEFIEVEK